MEEGHPVQSRMTIVLGTTALLTVVACGITFLASQSLTGSTGNAHIYQPSGSTNGLEPDAREGIKPSNTRVPNLDLAARRAGCELSLNLKDEGHRHLPVDAPRPKYKTSPPTSGPHVEEPYQQADGAYHQQPPDISVVHSLEHGRLAVQYDPHLAERHQLELLGLFNGLHGGSLLFPNPSMGFDVAATTWTNLLACDTYQGQATLDAIRAFGKATWGRYGGEAVIAVDPAAPTPRVFELRP